MNKQEYREYLKSTHWKELRERWMATKKHKRRHLRNYCKVCRSKENLELHHKTYKRLGRESLKDLVMLCNLCHREFHRRVKARTGYTKGGKSRLKVMILEKDKYWLKNNQI